MDLRKIKKLIELVEESGIAELEVRDGDEAIRIARPGGMATPGALQPAAPPRRRFAWTRIASPSRQRRRRAWRGSARRK